jgi:hypothetical protein
MRVIDGERPLEDDEEPGKEHEASQRWYRSHGAAQDRSRQRHSRKTERARENRARLAD